MKILILFKLALGNILGRNLRAIIGSSGIVLAITIFTFLASLGYGVNSSILSTVSAGQAVDILNITSGNESAIKLNNEVSEKISSVTGVDKICEIIDVSGKFSYKGTTGDTAVSAVCPEYFQYNGIKLPNDVKLAESVSSESQPIIINNYLAKMFGMDNPKDFLGQEVVLDILLNRNISKELDDQNINEKRMEGVKYLVVAVLNRGDSPYVYIPQSIVSSGGKVYNTTIQAIISPKADLAVIRSIIEVDGLKTENARDTIKEIKSFFGIFRLFLVVFGLVIAIIFFIGLNNLLNISLAERKKDLIWLKAIGMKSYEIKLMLIIESILLSIISVGLGLLIGFIFSWSANLMIKIISEKYNYTYESIFSIPISFIAYSTLFSIIFGYIVGFINAKKTGLLKGGDVFRSDY